MGHGLITSAIVLPFAENGKYFVNQVLQLMRVVFVTVITRHVLGAMACQIVVAVSTDVVFVGATGKVAKIAVL